MEVAHSPAPAKKNHAGVSFRTAKNAVARHPIIFMSLILVSSLIAAGVWLYLPLPKNTAVVVFQLSGQAPSVLRAGAENQVDLRTYGNLQAATVKRRQVLSNILKNPEVERASILQQQPDKLAWLDKNLLVDFKNGQEFMRVLLEGDNPEELLAIVKSVSTAYLAAVDQRDNGSRKQRSVLIEEAIAQQQSENSAKMKRIDVIAQSLKTTDGPTLAIMESLNQDELRSARRGVLDLDYKIELAKAELPNAAQENTPAVVPAALIDEALRREPAIVQSETQLTNIKSYLNELMSRFEPGTVNMSITKARQEVKAAEERLAKLRVELRSQVESAAKSATIADQKIKSIKQKEGYDLLIRQRQVAENQVAELVARINKHGEYRIELDKLRKDVASTEKILTSLTDERDRIRVEERAPSRVALAEDPFVQSGVEGNRRLKMTLIASLGVFAAGFVLLVFFENRGRRVTNTAELTAALGLPILGTIPIIRADEPKANRLLVEAVDSLRTQLLQTRRIDQPLRTVLVASGLSGEGKTTLTGHLAVSLVRAGYRVLLVDGDLHAPTVQKLFDIPAGPGLCEVLRGESFHMDAIHSTPVPGMFVMTAGTWNMATRQCLVGDRWSQVREQLQQDFDFVIVDTAPLLLMADTLLLAKASDGVVLSVLLGSSRLGAIGLTNEKLQSMAVRVLGAVVNGAESDYATEYYGRYKYSYGERTDKKPITIPVTVA